MKKLLCAILICLLLCGCYFPQQTPTETTTAPTLPDDTLQVHFIDVGQADCAFIQCGDFTMLIDGGNKADGSLVVSYLQRLGVSELDAVVCTHAHEDHVGGLASVLAVYPTGAVYAPTRTYSSEVFDNFVYYTDQQDLTITIPSPGDIIVDDQLTVTVMGPVDSYSDTNNTSLVLLLQHGQNRFLFTGDMETSAENDMLDYWGDGYSWDIDVLKVGHHGSDTSSGYRFLYQLMPTYAVISVGAGNSYGHPHEVPLSRLEQAGSTIYRTDTMGSIVVTSDASHLSFSWGDASVQPQGGEATQPSQTTPTQPSGQTYIGNINSKKFHTGSCSSLPKEENRVPFDSYQDAIDAGYIPCGNCLG